MKIKRSQIPNDLPAFFNEHIEPHVEENAAVAAVDTKVSRRQFFKMSGVAGGGLVIGGMALGNSKPAFAQDVAEDVRTLSPYVQITQTVVLPFSPKTLNVVRASRPVCR
jgi:hypothetical protein